MFRQHPLYAALTLIGIIAAVSTAVCFTKALLLPPAAVSTTARIALASLLVAIACMETRVRLGYRLPRAFVFWTHLAFSVPCLLLLAALSYRILPTSYLYADYALFLGVVATGSMLMHRGIRQTLESNRS